MQEVTTPENSSRKYSIKRKIIHVDMTPMVDLGFLLITFFMLTTNFSKPNILDLGLPAKDPNPKHNIPVIDYRNQLTFILGKKNRIFYYQKDIKNLTKKDIKETSFEGMTIPKLIALYKNTSPIPENFTIIIKPSKDAEYKSFVDILDDIAISKSERYGIAEMKNLEEDLYQSLIN